MEAVSSFLSMERLIGKTTSKRTKKGHSHGHVKCDYKMDDMSFITKVKKCTCWCTVKQIETQCYRKILKFTIVD